MAHWFTLTHSLLQVITLQHTEPRVGQYRSTLPSLAAKWYSIIPVLHCTAAVDLIQSWNPSCQSVCAKERANQSLARLLVSEEIYEVDIFPSETQATVINHKTHKLHVQVNTSMCLKGCSKEAPWKQPDWIIAKYTKTTADLCSVNMPTFYSYWTWVPWYHPSLNCTVLANPKWATRSLEECECEREKDCESERE